MDGVQVDSFVYYSITALMRQMLVSKITIKENSEPSRNSTQNLLSILKINTTKAPLPVNSPSLYATTAPPRTTT